MSDNVVVEYIGPSAKFVIDEIELVVGKAVTVSREIADRLAADARDHAFAFTEPDVKAPPLVKTTDMTATPTADYSPTASEVAAFKPGEPLAPE